MNIAVEKKEKIRIINLMIWLEIGWKLVENYNNATVGCYCVSCQIVAINVHALKQLSCTFIATFHT